MRLGVFVQTPGHHVGGWRHPDAVVDGWPNLALMKHIAATAERGKFDMFFLGDGFATGYGEHPSTIGKFVSSGCIRLTNEDVTDLFSRVDVGTRVVVLPKSSPRLEARGLEARGAIPVRPANAQARSVTTTSSSGRQAMNLSMSSLY